MNIEGSEREERTGLGSMGRTAFSVSALGLTAYSAMGVFMNVRSTWRRYPERIRKFLERPLPWETQSQNLSAKFTQVDGRYTRIKSIYEKPKSLMALVDKYNTGDYTTSMAMINDAAIHEIRYVEGLLRENEFSMRYLLEARSDVSHLLSPSDIHDISSADSVGVTKYRRALRKYKSLYDRTERRLGRDVSDLVAGQAHRDTLATVGHHYVPVEVDFGEIRYRGIQPMQLGLQGTPRVSVGDLLKAAESTTDRTTGRKFLEWDSRSIYTKHNQYSSIKFAGIDTQLTRLEKSLRAQLAAKAQLLMKGGGTGSLDALYGVDTELIDRGGGNMAVRFLLRLKDETYFTTLMDEKKRMDGRWLTEEVIVPLGNQGTIQFDPAGTPFVGRNRSVKGAWMDPSVQYANILNGESKNIVNGMVNGDRGWLTRSKGTILRHVTTAKGGLTDEFLRLEMEESEYTRLSGVYNWKPGEKEGVKAEVIRLHVERRALIRSQVSRPVLDAHDRRIKSLEIQLGKGGPAGQILGMLDAMGRKIDEYGDPTYFTEVSASQAGVYRYASIYGFSPMAMEANPQGAVHQFTNVYDLAPHMRTTYPIKYGGAPILPEEAYIPMRTAIVPSNMYPHNMSEIMASPRVYDHLTAPSAKAAGMGERSHIGIQLTDGKAIYNKSEVRLHALITELRNYTNSFTNVVDEARVFDIVKKHNVDLRPNSLITTTSGGQERRISKFGAKVVGVGFNKGELVLDLERNGGITNRFNIMGSASAIAVRMPIDMVERRAASNRPLDIVMAADIGRRINSQMLDVMLLAGAVDDLQYENIGLIKTINESTTKILSTKYPMKNASKEVAKAEERLMQNVLKLQNAARIGGLDPAIFAKDSGMGHMNFQKFQKLRPEQTDGMLRAMGQTYAGKMSPKDFKELEAVFMNEAMPILKNLGAPPEVMKRMTPTLNGAKIWSLLNVEGGTHIGITGLLLGGLMRQNASEMFKTYGLNPGRDEGIRFRYTELPFLLSRVSRITGEAGEAARTNMEKYVSYILGRMGGADVGKEYLNLVGNMSNLGGAGAIIPGSPDYMELMQRVAQTKVPRTTVETYVTAAGKLLFPDDATEISRRREMGEVLAPVEGYKIPNADLGVFSQGSKYFGRYVELPNPIDMNYGGVQTKVRRLYIPDPKGLKLQPTSMAGPGGEYTILPPMYARIYDILLAASGRQGLPDYSTPESNMRTILDAAIEDVYMGKRGFMRTDIMAAKEPGVRGIILTNTLLKQIDAWETKYDQMDIILPGKAFDDNIRETLHATFYSRWASEISDPKMLEAKIEGEIAAVKSGKTWMPSILGRDPHTGEMSRAYKRAWFQPKLDKMGEYSDFIYGDQLTISTIWGDTDFDNAAVALATHWSGAEPLRMLIDPDDPLRLGGRPPRIPEGSIEYNYATGKEVFGTGRLSALVTTLPVTVEGVPNSATTITIPKFFALSRVDKGTGNAFKILTHKDRIERGMKFIQGDPDELFRDPVTKKPYIYSGAAGWQDMLEAAVDEGRALNNTEYALLYHMDARDAASWETSERFGRMQKKLARNRNNQFTAVMAQKDFAGVATAHAMALNLVAMEHLSVPDQSIVSRTSAWYIQQVALKQKSQAQTDMRAGLMAHGTFTRAMSQLRTSDDTFAEILKSTLTQPGRVVAPDPPGFIDALIKIPPRKRENIFAGADLGYSVLHSTNNYGEAEGVFQRLLNGITNPEIGNVMEDVFKNSGWGTMLKSMSVPQSPVDMLRPPTKGYFARKPLLGPWRSPTKVQNTMLADAIGSESTAMVKYGLAGAASLGALYMAFNFFQPNQSATLGEMAGTGGEFWGPMRGRRTEMPWRVPIDTPEYTWQSPPWGNNRRARVQMYNPITAENLAKYPGKLQDALSPLVNWGVAPRSDVRYNKYGSNDRFTLDNAIRSSQVILSGR